MSDFTEISFVPSDLRQVNALMSWFTDKNELTFYFRVVNFLLSNYT